MIAEMSPLELKRRLDAGEAPLVIDVREAWELGICRLPGALHIPMSDIPARLGELDATKETIVLCRSGGRSLRVAEYLAGRGFARPVNLTGGILAWALQVDPSLPTY